MSEQLQQINQDLLNQQPQEKLIGNLNINEEIQQQQQKGLLQQPVQIP